MEFYQFRSMHALAWHLGESRDTPFCGNERVLYAEERKVSLGDVERMLPRQHAGFYWCVRCAALATGIPEDEVAAFGVRR